MEMLTVRLTLLDKATGELSALILLKMLSLAKLKERREDSRQNVSNINFLISGYDYLLDRFPNTLRTCCYNR